jgi:hypothetical protein
MIGKVTFTMAGKNCVVPKMTPIDFMDLCQRLYVRDREALLQDLEDAGAPPELRVEQLKELRRRASLSSNVYMALLTVDGAMMIIDGALERGGIKDIKVSDAMMHADELSRIAAEICNFDLEGAMKGGGSDDADPLMNGRVSGSSTRHGSRTLVQVPVIP